MDEGQHKVVGMGSAGLDYLAEVSQFPQPDDKMRTKNLEMQGGGNCGNALTAAARLGLKPVIVSKIGSDSVGDAIVEEFENDGVDTTFLLRSQTGRSPFTYIIVDRESNTRTCIHTPGEPFLATEMENNLVNRILDGASVIYFDGRLADAAGILAKRAYDLKIPVLVEAERLRPGLEDLLQYASCVVTSAKFPHEWTGKTCIDDAMVAMMARLPHVKWIATTLGSRGALLLERIEEPHKEPYVVKALDGSMVEKLFLEASKLRKASDNTSTKSSVQVNENLRIYSRSIFSSDPFIVRLSKSDKERATEAEMARNAARRAARLNADADNVSRYSGKIMAEDSSENMFCLSSVESAELPKERVLDTTGAGDAFIGSMLYSVAMNMPPIKGCELATLVAACKCTKLGARPGLPTMDRIHLL